MKKKVLTLFIAFGMILGNIIPIQANQIKPIRSNTMFNANNLFACGQDYERLQAVYTKSASTLDSVVLERYNANFDLISQKALDLTQITPTGCASSDILWGGAFEGTNYNFILTGQRNESQNESKKVVRVTRFNKDWSYSAFGEYDYQTDKVEAIQPFDYSFHSDMKEMNGQLWISTSHLGFKMSGIAHQGKMNLIININDMSLAGSASDFDHSFAQYLSVCNGNMYQMELSEGDRCVFVEKLDAKNYKGGWSDNRAAGSSEHANIFKFYEMDRVDGMWSYDTGGDVCGFASSDSGSRLLATGNSVNQDALKIYKTEKNDNAQLRQASNAWICSTSTDLKTNDLKYLTHFADNGEDLTVTHGPLIEKINDHRFLAAWSVESQLSNIYSDDGYPRYEDNVVTYKPMTGIDIAKVIKDSRKIQYCFVNEFGDPISQIYEMPGTMTYSTMTKNEQNDVSWYSIDGGCPVFYTVHNDGTNTIKDTNPSFDLNNITFNDVIVTYDKKEHQYPKVQNLPAGLQVKYDSRNDDDVNDPSDRLAKATEYNAGKYTVYAYFVADDEYARLLGDQPKEAHLIIKPKNINTLKIDVKMYKKKFQFITLYDGDDMLSQDDEYKYKVKGNIATVVGVKNYTGTIKVNIKTGKVIKGSNTKKKVSQAKTLKNVKSDEGPKGTTYRKLQLKYRSAKNNTMKVGWKKIKGCSYDVYMAKCGQVFKKIKTTRQSSYTFKKLKKKTFYKVLVVATKKKKAVSLSKSVHIYTGKGNATLMKLKMSRTIKKGQTVKYKVQSNQKVRKHRGIQCESSNSKILKVTKKGVKALKKGKATLYIYTQDGIGKKITVTVK